MTSLFSSLLDKMGGTPKSTLRAEVTRESSSDSTISALTVDEASNAQSSSSTPPTSIGDSTSISSSLPQEKSQPPPEEEFGGRSRRQRTSVGTYNVKVLSGTAIHAPKKYCKNKPETGNAPRRRTISGGTPNAALASEDSPAVGEDDTIRSAGIDALNLDWSPKRTVSQSRAGPKKTPKTSEPVRGRSARKYGEPSPSAAKKTSVLGKRSRKSFDVEGLSGRAQRELKRLQDTNEFAKIETKPVIYEVWKNGKLVVEGEEETPKPKKAPSAPVQTKAPAHLPVQAPAVPEPKAAEVPIVARKKEKSWLPMGLYAGQEVAELNWFKGYKGPKEVPDFRPDGVLPLPLWHGQRLLFHGRDFKLPFDICAPLPPGQAKPDEWRKTSSSK